MPNLFLLIFLFQAVKSTPQGVRFEYYNPQAKSVYLAGDFNNWSTTSHSMRREDDGTFWIVMRLSPGKYEYKFIVDGQWTADPDNPVTVGVYGNSLVRVGENYAVLPPEMATNTPVSSIVNFALDARSSLTIDEDTLEGVALGYRTVDFMQDLKVDLDANFEEKADLWIRLRFNTSSFREAQTQLIPVKFERGFLNLKGNEFNFYAFYNVRKIKGTDPFRLMAEVGEFGRDFGEEEQGFMLDLKRFLILNNLKFVYSNQILSDRDLFYSDFGKDFGRFRIGVAFRAQRGLNKMYRVPSPDSLMEDSLLLFFNLYENEYLLGPYSKLEFGKFYCSFGGLVGDRKVYAGEKYVGDAPYPVDKSWPKSRIIKGVAQIKGFTGKWLNEGVFDYEKHYYRGWYLDGKEGFYRYFRFGLGTSYNGYFGLNFRYTSFQTDTNMVWKLLFEDLENQRLSYSEFPFISYKHYFTLAPHVKYSFKGINLKYDGRLNVYALNRKPLTFENIIHVDFKLWKPILTYELRTFTIKSSYLNLNKTYLDHFAEVAYKIGKNAQVSINYGYLPWNLEDEYIARREYTISKGVDYSLLINNFRGLGTFLDLAETSLSKERGIQLWLKIAF